MPCNLWCSGLVPFPNRIKQQRLQLKRAVTSSALSSFDWSTAVLLERNTALVMGLHINVVWPGRLESSWTASRHLFLLAARVYQILYLAR